MVVVIDMVPKIPNYKITEQTNGDYVKVKVANTLLSRVKKWAKMLNLDWYDDDEKLPDLSSDLWTKTKDILMYSAIYLHKDHLPLFKLKWEYQNVETDVRCLY